MDLKFDFKSLNERSEKALLDSGTTFVYFPSELFEVFKLQLASVCRRNSVACAKTPDFQSCYTYNANVYPNIQDFFDTFPPISFILNGVELIWEPREYLFQADSAMNYCLAIYPLEDIVLGAAFMRNFDIKFDLRDQKLSFARANCDGSRPITLTPQNYTKSNISRTSVVARRTSIKSSLKKTDSDHCLCS